MHASSAFSRSRARPCRAVAADPAEEAAMMAALGLPTSLRPHTAEANQDTYQARPPPPPPPCVPLASLPAHDPSTLISGRFVRASRGTRAGLGKRPRLAAAACARAMQWADRPSPGRELADQHRDSLACVCVWRRDEERRSRGDRAPAGEDCESRCGRTWQRLQRANRPERGSAC